MLANERAPAALPSARRLVEQRLALVQVGRVDAIARDLHLQEVDRNLPLCNLTHIMLNHNLEAFLARSPILIFLLAQF